MQLDDHQVPPEPVPGDDPTPDQDPTPDKEPIPDHNPVAEKGKKQCDWREPYRPAELPGLCDPG